MKFLEVAKTVVESKTAHLIRPRKGEDMEYDVKPMFTGGKRGWTLLDTFTAGAVVMVAGCLVPENRGKLNHHPAAWVCDFALKHVGAVGGTYDEVSGVETAQEFAGAVRLQRNQQA